MHLAPSTNARHRRAEDRESRRTHRTWCPELLQPSERLSVTSSSSLGAHRRTLPTTINIIKHPPCARLATIPRRSPYWLSSAYTRRSLRVAFVSALARGPLLLHDDGGNICATADDDDDDTCHVHRRPLIQPGLNSEPIDHPRPCARRVHAAARRSRGRLIFIRLPVARSPRHRDRRQLIATMLNRGLCASRFKNPFALSRKRSRARSVTCATQRNDDVWCERMENATGQNETIVLSFLSPSLPPLSSPLLLSPCIV